MKKIYKQILLVGAIVFTLQFVFSPLMHNHKLDLKEHYNCPSYILSVTLASLLVVFITNIKIKFPKANRNFITIDIIYHSPKNKNCISNRAPPFLFVF
jgi:hypothetical protein